MPNEHDDFGLRRALRQQLESLQRSGVMQLPRAEAIEVSTADSPPLTHAASPTPSVQTSVADTDSSVTDAPASDSTRRTNHNTES